MEIDVVLCNHAETAENRLYIAGGGVNLYFVPPSVPHVITVGLGCVLHIPYLETNESHMLKVPSRSHHGRPRLISLLLQVSSSSISVVHPSSKSVTNRP